MSLDSEKVCEQRTTGIRGSLRGPRGPKKRSQQAARELQLAKITLGLQFHQGSYK